MRISLCFTGSRGFCYITRRANQRPFYWIPSAQRNGAEPGSADKRSAGLPAEGGGDADFPLLHRKQRFLFYRLPGEPAAF